MAPSTTNSKVSLLAAAAVLTESLASVTIGGVYLAGGLPALATAPAGTTSLAQWLAQRAAEGAPPLLAYGLFNDTIDANGWSVLELHTNGSIPDRLQARAAGYFEGAVTNQRSYEFITNVHGGKSRWSPQLTQFVHDNLNWIAIQSDANGKDPFWWQTGLLFEQWEGLYAGYSAYAPPAQQFDRDTFYAATLIGDMDDLCVAFGCYDRRGNGSEPVFTRFSSDGHCSVLVKPLGPAAAPTELIIGHTTWNPFEVMTRIYKHYDFPWHTTYEGKETVAAQHISFSSFPAVLYSFDDYYQTSAGLTITETTIINNNASLWQYVTTDTVPEWARNMLANRLVSG